MDEQGTWKSVRPGWISWTYDDVRECAASMKAHLPAPAIVLIMTSGLMKLITLQDESSATIGDLDRNYYFIKPMVIRFPCFVASGYFITDVLLKFAQLLDGKLYSGLDDEGRKTAAAEDAKRLKICFGDNAMEQMIKNEFQVTKPE